MRTPKSGEPFNPHRLFVGLFIPLVLASSKSLSATAKLAWGHLGEFEANGRSRLSGFVFTLAHNRAMTAEAAFDHKLGTLLRLHEEAFRQLGGCQTVFSTTG